MAFLDSVCFLSLFVVHIATKFPITPEKWNQLIVGAMNSKCRNTKRDVGLNGRNKDFHVEILE